MATVLISGGTGMIGMALARALLKKNYEVIVLTRHKAQDPRYKEQGSREVNSVHYAEWNVEKRTIDQEAIAKADYIIHLAGANLGEKRWTKKRKQEMMNSRVESAKLIVDSLQHIPNKVKAVISASAIGWYGPDLSTTQSITGKSFKETDAFSDDFLGQTSKLWEESIQKVKDLRKRLVILRTGIVLSRDGGAFPRFLQPLKFGLATILGSGRQIISWIHIDDLVRVYITSIENEKLSGVYNAVSPNPVSNKEFVLTLARTRKKFFIPFQVPSFILKLILGEMSIEVLKSATVSAEKIQQAGFEFLYPTIEEALNGLTVPVNMV